METGQSRITAVLLEEMRCTSQINFPQWLFGYVANTMFSLAHRVPKSLSLERGHNCHSKSADHYTSQFNGGGRKMDQSMDWQGTETTDITTENSITNYTAMCSITDESNYWNQGKNLSLKMHSEWRSRKQSPCLTRISEHILAPTWSIPSESSSWGPQDLWSIGPCP